MLALPAAQRPLGGTLRVVGDKSLSHRALMLGAWAHGTTELSGLLLSEDVLATRHALEALGVRIEATAAGTLLVQGAGGALQPPTAPLDCQNAGTTMRLLAGLLVAGNTPATLIGDASLSRRPMGRLLDVLGQMGASLSGSPHKRPPLVIARHKGLSLGPLELPIPSAQLGSAALLAALGAKGRLTLVGLGTARDHSQRMLRAFGADISEPGDGRCEMVGAPHLQGRSLSIAGDLSSAAVWLAAATLLSDSELELPHVNLNPTRLGFVRVLQRMGARIELQPDAGQEAFGHEPVGTLRCRAAPLIGCNLRPADVPTLIDELPLLAVVATAAHGTTRVTGAAQLRIKESDRIESICSLLSSMGARIEALPDGFVVEGPTPLRAAPLYAHDDHRIAMAAAVAASIAKGTSTLLGAEAAAVSYPGFWRLWHERMQAGGQSP